MNQFGSTNKKSKVTPLIFTLAASAVIGLLFWSTSAQTDMKIDILQKQLEVVQQDADFKLRGVENQARAAQNKFLKVSEELERMRDELDEAKAMKVKSNDKRTQTNKRNTGVQVKPSAPSGLEDLGSFQSGARDDPTGHLDLGKLRRNGKKRR